MSSPTIELHNAGWRLQVDPAMGGCVMGLWLEGKPVLRPAPNDASCVGQSAAYPLVPYSNRIGQGHMTWRGRTHTIRNGFNLEPHALHGVGLIRAWTVVEQSADTLRLRFSHLPDEFWPFAFTAEQYFELHDDGLALTISALNNDRQPQPMGLGWHPYFVRRPDSALDLPVHTQWLVGDDLLPREPKAVNGLQGTVAGMRLDNCFEGAGCVAKLTVPQVAITLEADSRYWVVYTPKDSAYFCVEPVTHLNNAVQQIDPLQHGVVELLQGEMLRQRVRLTAQVTA